MSVAAFEIQGRTLTLPVQVRSADSWAAQFLVPAKAAQRIVAPTGLEVATPMPGKAMLNIAFVDYRDTDLGAYHELAIAFLVRKDSAAGSGSRVREFFRGETGVYIHHLPVTQTFTLEAGRKIWGYPKFLADIDITSSGGRVSCTLQCEGTHILTLSLKERGPIRLPKQDLPTYTLMDGVLRRTEWDQEAPMRGRLGGATLELGTDGAIVEELRSLGLPKRALMTSTMRGMRATFGASTVL